MRVSENLGLVLTVLLSYIVPKKKNYWVFTSLLTSGKYTGNCKYVFEYAVNHPEDSRGLELAYIINPQVSNIDFDFSKLPIKYNKWFWTFALLRAEIVVVDGVKVGLGLGRFKYVQLWHGAGFKNILLHNNHETKGMDKSLFSKSFLLKSFLKKIILLTATSKTEKIRRQKAFQKEDVIITGSPRNDYFNNKKNIDNAQGIILYAPTFRNYSFKLNFITEQQWTEMNELMKRKNSIFMVKKHPADKLLKVPKNYSHIKDVSKEIEDIQILLGKADVLITDYSSISTDYALTHRPIIFYTYDFEHYLNNDRSTYYDLKKVLPGPFAHNYEHLFRLLSNLSWFKENSYRQKYSDFKNLFHQFDDGKSSERTFKEILKLKSN